MDDGDHSFMIVLCPAPKNGDIIRLLEAPNPMVGDSQLLHVYLYKQVYSRCCSCLVLKSSHDITYQLTNQNAVLICSILIDEGGGEGKISVTRRVLR